MLLKLLAVGLFPLTRFPRQSEKIQYPFGLKFRSHAKSLSLHLTVQNFSQPRLM